MPGAMTSALGFEQIEVITSVQRRRRWSLDEKIRAVEESSIPGMTVSFVARKYGISPSQLFRWRKLMAERGKVAVGADDAVVSAQEQRELKRRIRDLERALGRKTLEVEILKEAIEVGREIKLISRVPLLPEDDSR